MWRLKPRCGPSGGFLLAGVRPDLSVCFVRSRRCGPTGGFFHTCYISIREGDRVEGVVGYGRATVEGVVRNRECGGLSKGPFWGERGRWNTVFFPLGWRYFREESSGCKVGKLFGFTYRDESHGRRLWGKVGEREAGLNELLGHDTVAFTIFRLHGANKLA